jgi:hypothetical protein
MEITKEEQLASYAPGISKEIFDVLHRKLVQIRIAQLDEEVPLLPKVINMLAICELADEGLINHEQFCYLRSNLELLY